MPGSRNIIASQSLFIMLSARTNENRYLRDAAVTNARPRMSVKQWAGTSTQQSQQHSASIHCAEDRRCRSALSHFRNLLLHADRVFNIQDSNRLGLRAITAKHTELPDSRTAKEPTINNTITARLLALIAVASSQRWSAIHLQQR